MTTPLITASLLRELGASKEQVALVGRVWPDGMTVTAASLRHAHRMGLDIGGGNRRCV